MYIYQNINTIRMLITALLMIFVAFCGETCNLQMLIAALAAIVGVSISINLSLVVITRLKYFDRKISRKEVVPPFWRL